MPSHPAISQTSAPGQFPPPPLLLCILLPSGHFLPFPYTSYTLHTTPYTLHLLPYTTHTHTVFASLDLLIRISMSPPSPLFLLHDPLPVSSSLSFSLLVIVVRNQLWPGLVSALLCNYVRSNRISFLLLDMALREPPKRMSRHVAILHSRAQVDSPRHVELGWT